ncbi:MAG: hypothetical protein K6A89_12635 [Treponema sp.]|nr:hypothetical protein [Treponema sp.]
MKNKLKNELLEKYSCDKIIYPSKELAAVWSQIPAVPENDRTVIKAVTAWLDSAEEKDVLVIQGEFGATFIMVDYALKNKMIPLHAVTKRVETEQRDGEIVHRQYVFEHVCFRRYEYY